MGAGGGGGKTGREGGKRVERERETERLREGDREGEDENSKVFDLSSWKEVLPLTQMRSCRRRWFIMAG